MTILTRLFRKGITTEAAKAGFPSRRYHHIDVRFKNGAAVDMNVDGTVPKEFISGPVPGEIWIVDYITLIVLDAGDMLPTNFGSLAGLANGLQVFSNMAPLLPLGPLVERQSTNLKDNLDILQCFAGSKPGSSGIGPVDDGFLNTVDYISGRLSYDGGEFVLIGDNGDHLGFRVRDDLSGIDNMRASLHARVLLM